MDRRLKIQVGGKLKRWPLRYCLRGVSPDSLFHWLRDQPPPIAGEALVAAMTSQLGAAASIDAWVRVGQGHDYGFRGNDDKARMVELALRVMDGYDKKALAPLTKAAKQLLGAGHLQAATATWVIVALARLSAAGQKPLPAQFDPLWVAALNGELCQTELRELLEKLPRARLERLFESIRIHHRAEPDGSIRVWGGWLYFDLCPTETVMQKVVDHIVRWRENERFQRDQGVKQPAHPRERAIELLVHGGDASVRPLLAALSVKKPCKHADVLEEALTRLGHALPPAPAKEPRAKKRKRAKR